MPTSAAAASRRETIKSLVEGDLRVTVYRRPGTANLQMEVERKDPSLPRGEREKRRSLGHDDENRAITEAYEVLTALRAKQAKEGKSGAALTLGQVVTRYLASEAFKGTTERVRDDRETMLETVTSYIKWDSMTATNLSQEDILGYMKARVTGAHGDHKVSKRRAQAELQTLRTALNWAYATKFDGKRLVGERVFEGLTIPEAQTAARPTISEAEVAKLWETRDKHSYPVYGLALALAYVYGKRSNSIRHLRAEAVNLTSEPRSYKGIVIPPLHVFWDPEFDKEDESGIFPLPPDIVILFEDWALHAKRKNSPWVFYAPKNPKRPAARVSFQQFGDQGFDNAKVSKPKHGGWHMFRRAFATRNAHDPKVAMRLGGWKDVSTFIGYQQPDASEMLRVLNHRALTFGEKAVR